MYEPKSREINGIKFKIVPFPSLEALRIKATLAKLIVPSLGAIFGDVIKAAGKEKALDTEIDFSNLPSILESTLSKLDEDSFINLIQRLLKGVSAEIESKNEKIWVTFDSTNSMSFSANMDLVFQGKLFTIYPVLAFVWEVNFPDFFERMADIGNRLKITMSKMSAESVNKNLKKSERSERSAKS